jgi:hypothetical protein
MDIIKDDLPGLKGSAERVAMLYLTQVDKRARETLLPETA